MRPFLLRPCQVWHLRQTHKQRPTLKVPLSRRSHRGLWLRPPEPLEAAVHEERVRISKVAGTMDGDETANITARVPRSRQTESCATGGWVEISDQVDVGSPRHGTTLSAKDRCQRRLDLPMTPGSRRPCVGTLGLAPDDGAARPVRGRCGAHGGDGASRPGPMVVAYRGPPRQRGGAGIVVPTDRSCRPPREDTAGCTLWLEAPWPPAVWSSGRATVGDDRSRLRCPARAECRWCRAGRPARR